MDPLTVAVAAGLLIYPLVATPFFTYQVGGYSLILGTIALSLMAGLSIGMIERAIANQRTEQILVLAKAIGLGWDTAKAVLLLQAGANGTSGPELDQCCETFARLRQDTAQKAIRFYRLRERAAKTN